MTDDEAIEVIAVVAPGITLIMTVALPRAGQDIVPSWRWRIEPGAVMPAKSVVRAVIEATATALADRLAEAADHLGLHAAIVDGAPQGAVLH